MDMQLEYKVRALRAWVAAREKVAVAFSSGVDSTFLLAVAHDVLGDGAVALTATSPTFPERERAEARAFCKARGIRQVEFESGEFDIPGFDHNPENRCYLCKGALFGHIKEIAAEQGLGVVCDGSNTDDLGDYRPGRQALLELGIESPLLFCGFSKEDIREASRAMGLPTAEKQSFACLSSRFPYGTLISPELLRKVDAAEQALLDLGFKVVRVRVNGDEARIEVGADELPRAFELRERIVPAVKEVGFAYVALDLQGYRTGAMNETL